MSIELIHFSGLCDAQLVGQLEESPQGCLGRRLCLQVALIKQLLTYYCSTSLYLIYRPIYALFQHTSNCTDYFMNEIKMINP